MSTKAKHNGQRAHDKMSSSAAPPAPQPPPPPKCRQVQLRIIFLRVGDIDTVNEKFFAEILVESKWEEPLLKLEFDKNQQQSASNTYAGVTGSALNSGSLKEERELKHANKYWNPQIYIENALNDPKQTVHHKIKKEPAREECNCRSTGNNHNNNNNNLSSLVTTTNECMDAAAGMDLNPATVSIGAGDDEIGSGSDLLLQPQQQQQQQQQLYTHHQQLLQKPLPQQQQQSVAPATPKFTYWIYEYRKIKGHFFEKLELNYFPLDTQDLSIIISTFRSCKEVKLVQNYEKMSMVNSKITLDQHIWHLYRHVEVKHDYDYDYEDETLETSVRSKSTSSDNMMMMNADDMEQYEAFKSKHEHAMLHTTDTSQQQHHHHHHHHHHSHSHSVLNKHVESTLKSNKLGAPHESDTNTEVIKYSMIMFQIRAARRSGYFFWNAFFLIFLITSSVFGTFSIEVDTPYYRLPVTATLLLTSITFRWTYSTRCLPTVNYLTSLDKYSISSLILIYLCLVWHGSFLLVHSFISLRWHKYIDKLVCLSLFIFYLGTHVVALMWLRAAYAKRQVLKQKDAMFIYTQLKRCSSCDDLVAEAVDGTLTQNLKLSNFNSLSNPNQNNGNGGGGGGAGIGLLGGHNNQYDNMKSDAVSRTKSRRLSSQFKGFLSNLNLNVSKTNLSLNQRPLGV